MYISPILYDDGFGLIGALSLLSSFTNLISVALVIFVIYCYCQVYKKLGLDWWAYLIPFYGTYVLAKRVWDQKHAKIILGVSIGACIMAVISLYIAFVAIIMSIEVADEFALLGMLGFIMLFVMVALAVAIVETVFEVMLLIRLGRAFGKSDGFGFGLWLLNPIFIGILALSKNCEAVNTVEIPGKVTDLLACVEKK